MAMEDKQGAALAAVNEICNRFEVILRKEMGKNVSLMAMSPQALVETVSLINGINASDPWVLELGSGVSTIAMHKLCPDAHILSLDHSLDWMMLMVSRILPEFDLELKAPSFMMIPRNPTEIGHYQVILVDHGPQLQTRADDLPWIVKCLAPGGVMIFDDWRPKHEGRIRRGLAKIGDFKIDSLENTKRHAKDKSIALARRRG
jgi:hypothetical protein